LDTALPKSSLPFNRFPAIPDGAGSTLLALLYQLEQSQWWTPEQLRRQQSAQLGQLLEHAWRSIPFYREQLAQAGYRGRTEDPFAVLQTLPILTRAILQEDMDRIRSSQIPESHGGTYPRETSGSTGRPVKLLGTGVTNLFWRAFAVREHLWHGRDFSAKLAAIRWARKDAWMPPEGKLTSTWGPPLDGLFDTGPGAFLNVAADTEAQLQWLQRTDPGYVISYPSQLAVLAEESLKRDLRLPQLREVRTVGETVTERQRELCQEAWGVSLTDMYSCEEAGYLALQCPQSGEYHVQAENIVLEILDDNGSSCKRGEVGRVVITGLHNFATPLLRYELGDFAEVGAACPCGRGLAVIRRILGRMRNRIRLPDGSSRFPYLGERKERERIAPGILQFQYVQKSLDEIEYRIVTAARLTKEQEQQLRQFIIGNFGASFRVNITYHQEIPRSPSGKYEEFISELG
jgi:phenylacetate-CoA ligase